MIPTILNPATPTAVDAVLMAANVKLAEKLPWLNNLYGKAQKLNRLDDKKRVIKYPAIYTGKGKEYASMLPDEHFGNFTWWDVADYGIETQGRQLQVINADFGLVLWFNVNKVLAADERRNLEMIKQDVLEYFAGLSILGARVECNAVTEDFNKIYQGYSTKEVDKQYLIHPFAGLRFNGSMRIEKYC
ncbi:hypothetical protein B620_gp18 [Croceibacter phage P2559S]|uniref:hypothetical protein n=1 Tax=Croceibacter phage P2559S TaxID=1176422 RepID=UPI0002688EAD|nr:hypothetical protein B620_gp18 [Croceibacter phage P2559S]AFM54796.1 hypothetical protein P2559S_18 [Croceibacter phage P2559S]